MNTNKTNHRSLAFSLQLSAFSLFFAGCGLPAIEPAQVDEVRLFTLSAPPVEVSSGERVRVKPVELAGHLRRRELAVRVAENEVAYLENARWAEPLDTAITNLLEARLVAIGRGGSIEVKVLRCEPLRFKDNTVLFAGTYTITWDSDPTRSNAGMFASRPRVWDGRDRAALVGLLREAVNEMGDDLAKNLSADLHPAGSP